MGENATGESDLENYKEFVGGLQNGDLRDNTRTLVELILRGMVWNREVKEIPEYTVTYKSAWSPSDDEKAAQDQAAAAAQLTRAQTAGTYVTNGIVEAEEVRRAMVRDEQFDPENILTEADIHQDWGLGGADTQQEAADSQQQNGADASGLVTDEGDCGYVAGFVVQDGKILCGRRSDGQGWCGPGGHIEPKETPGVAFRREAKEEFGIDVGNITYLGNCKGKPEEILPVQIYRVNDYAGIPVCDQEEMFTAAWFTPEQILAQEVPGGLVFDPFRRSVEEYLEQLGLTLDDFDPSKHKRDEDGKFSSMGNTTSKDESGKENCRDIRISAKEVEKLLSHLFFFYPKTARREDDTMKYKHLSYSDRQEMEKLYLQGWHMNDIAAKLGVSLATVYHERARGDTGKMDKNGRGGYSAELAQSKIYARRKELQEYKP